MRVNFADMLIAEVIAVPMPIQGRKQGTDNSSSAASTKCGAMFGFA